MYAQLYSDVEECFCTRMTTCWIVRTGRTLSTDRSARWGWGSSSRTRLVVSAVSVKPRERLNEVIANHRQELDSHCKVMKIRECVKNTPEGGMQKWGGEGDFKRPFLWGGDQLGELFRAASAVVGAIAPFGGL